MRTKFIGNKTFYDEYGNPHNMDIIQKDLDSLDKKGWRRVILSDMLEVLEQIGNKKIKVLEYLIDAMNGKNEIYLSQREISDETGISIQTVNTTLQALVDANLIKKIKHKYVLNTQIVSAYGDKEKNKMLTIQYGFFDGAKKQEPQEPTDEEKLKMLLKQVAKLEAKINSNKIIEENPDKEEKVA